MTPEHEFVVDDAVLEFFSGRSRREQEELLRIWHGLAAAPHQKGEWLHPSPQARQGPHMTESSSTSTTVNELARQNSSVTRSPESFCSFFSRATITWPGMIPRLPPPSIERMRINNQWLSMANLGGASSTIAKANPLNAQLNRTTANEATILVKW
jgi:hypothetical protein